MSDSDKIVDLENRLKALESKMGESDKKSKKVKVPRKATAYNIFLKKELVKVKKENKDLTHKEAWAQATKNWAGEKEKNGK